MLFYDEYLMSAIRFHVIDSLVTAIGWAIILIPVGVIVSVL